MHTSMVVVRDKAQVMHVLRLQHDTNSGSIGIVAILLRRKAMQHGSVVLVLAFVQLACDVFGSLVEESFSCTAQEGVIHFIGASQLQGRIECRLRLETPEAIRAAGMVKLLDTALAGAVVERRDKGRLSR